MRLCDRRPDVCMPCLFPPLSADYPHGLAWLAVHVARPKFVELCAPLPSRRATHCAPPEPLTARGAGTARRLCPVRTRRTCIRH